MEWLLTGNPRDVQKAALAHSFYRPDGPMLGYMFAMEMRLGKTPTVLNEIALFRKYHGLERVLIVAPNSFKGTWDTEAQRFQLPGNVHVHTGNSKATKAFIVKGYKDPILVVNYESLLSKAFDDLLGYVNSRTYVVFDESAIVKNPQAKTTKVAFKLGAKAGWVRCLSGLPAPQASYDLWSQLKLCRMSEFPRFYPFKLRFTEFGGWMNKQAIGNINQEEIDCLMDKYAFRARSEDWGRGQGIDREVVRIPMTREQSKAYDVMNRDLVLYLSGNEEPITAANVLSRYTKLQQISSGFAYDAEGKPNAILPFDKTAKFEDLVTRLSVIRGKVIIFALYKYTVSNLLASLTRHHPARITGQMSTPQLKQQVDRFNNDPSCKVLVAQVNAARYGHTLVGSKESPCVAMCFYENSYSLNTRKQCEARPQGGHVKDIYLWDYACSEAEERVIQALNKREALSTVIMSAYKGG